MAYLLDTNIIIHLMDDDTPSIVEHIAGLRGVKQMSIITRVEIEGGLAKISDELRRRRFGLMQNSMHVLPFGEKEADAYRTIVESLGYSRRKLLDRMIAAQALTAGFTLITRNGDDFRDVPGLKLLEL